METPESSARRAAANAGGEEEARQMAKKWAWSRKVSVMLSTLYMTYRL